MEPQSELKAKTQTDALELLVAFVVGSPKVTSPIALERSVNALKDTIGCMLFGYASPEAEIVRKTVSAWGGGGSVIVGGPTDLPIPWAAFANATAAHALDYDDWDDPSLTHTSAILFPTILAAMSESPGSGDELVDAHIVGVEVLLRLGVALNPTHYWKGWHSTSTIGTIGAAAAAARVYRLDHLQTANALSLATSMAGGFVSQFGAMAKPMHAGMAAKAGLIAASLARNGATGTPGTLDGETSLRTLMSDASPDAMTRAFERLGSPYAIEEFGLHTKLYPSCGGTHRVIDACLQIVEDHGPDAEEIDRIILNIPEFLMDLLPYEVPKNRNEALFSFPYCASAAMCRGRVGIDEFSDEALSDRQILDLAARVERSTRNVEYVTKLCVEGDYDRVTVVMQSGQQFSAEVDIPVGAPPRTAPTEVIDRKFMDCARRGAPIEQGEAILALLNSAPGSWTYAQLAALLSVPNGVSG